MSSAAVDELRFVNAIDCRHTVEIETAQTIAVAHAHAWGTDDVFFDLRWSRWLEEAIPDTKRWVEFEGARIFFPEERPDRV